MDEEMNPEMGIIARETNDSPEAMVLSKERWEEIKRLHGLEKLKVSQIARRLDIDRKTVRKALHTRWKRYERASRSDTLLAEHDAFLRARAAQVNYSARILYQELIRDRAFRGSYQTIKRFVAPLRAAARCGSSPSAPRRWSCAASSRTGGEATSPPRMAPARGPPLWEIVDAGQDEYDPQAQPAPDYEFDQRIAW